MTIAPERAPSDEQGQPSAPPNRIVVILATVVLALLGSSLIWLVLQGDDDVTDSGERIRGSGNVVTETRSVSGFDGVTLMAAGRLLITQGTEESLTIETDDNLMSYLETKVSGGKLEISAEKDDISYNLDPSDDVVFRIGVIDLNDLTVYGGGDIEMDALATTRLDIEIIGAADVTIGSLTADQLRIDVPGASDIELAGEVLSQEVRWLGAGSYSGGELRSDTAVVSVVGAATLEVWTSDNLDITVTGAGTINYYGTPVVNQNVTGVGIVRSLGPK